MNYLITGAAGFIGSHIVEELLNTGNKVVGIDNFDLFYSKQIKKKNLKKALKDQNYIFEQVDIRNISELKNLFSRYNFDVVIHLAAKAGVRPSISDSFGYFQTNLEGTQNILDCLKANKCKLIFASSSSVYGNNKKTPFSEQDTVDHPISPYAASKKAAELLCYTYHHLYNLDVFCLRFFTVYGPRQRPDLAIHKFTDKILAGMPIEVYGDGSTARDYTYIKDIVQGVCNAALRVKGYEIFNLGGSKTIQLSEMISVIEMALEKKAIIQYLPMQPGDVNLTNADILKAKKMLDYNPKWDFKRGVEEFVKWKRSV